MSNLTNEQIDAIIENGQTAKPKPLKPRPTLEQRIAMYQDMCIYEELIDDAKYRMSKKRRDPTSSSYQPLASTSDYKPSDQPSATSPVYEPLASADHQPSPKKYKWEQLDATPQWQQIDYNKAPPTPRCEIEERFPEIQMGRTAKATIASNKENKPENFKKPTIPTTKPQLQSITVEPKPSTQKVEPKPSTQTIKPSTSGKPEPTAIQQGSLTIAKQQNSKVKCSLCHLTGHVYTKCIKYMESIEKNRIAELKAKRDNIKAGNESLRDFANSIQNMSQYEKIMAINNLNKLVSPPPPEEVTSEMQGVVRPQTSLFP